MTSYLATPYYCSEPPGAYDFSVRNPVFLQVKNPISYIGN
eukprot:SAG31_NODE_47387_length_246_cov_3.306122_1_plen_39_part_10